MAENPKFEFDLFISYAQADAAWVEGYLLDTLEAAEVTCQSEETFALGVPRIVEFERAIATSRRVLLVLSPAYLADEFSQFTDLLAQTYGLETATWPVIPLILHPTRLPPRLATLNALDATDPEGWEGILARLLAELQRPVPQALPKPPCPYPGMAPFAEADNARFYGRDREIAELLQRLRLHPFVAVIGPSGSGKSSLVYAGLIPALRKSGLFGSSPKKGAGWLVRTMRPGEAPLAALAGILTGDLSDPGQAVAALLAAEPEADKLLLVIDQFEETFTTSAQDAEAFQRALQQLAQADNCYTVLTIRADFYAELMSCPLWSDIQAHRFEVLPMDEAGLRQAIVRPAEDVGVFVETALVERLVADASGEPGILPLVQETLVLLWEHVKRRFMPLRAYEALVLARDEYSREGLTGLQVAMARRADSTLAELPSQDQPIARRIILRLVQFGDGRADTRRQQPILALRSAGEDTDRFERVLDHLVCGRLLTMSGDESAGGRRADIAHEALIGGWPTLRGWLDERREAEQTRRRLEGKAIEWGRLGRGGGGLLDEVELLEAARWLESPDAAALGHSDDLLALVGASRAAIQAAARQREAVRQRELEQTRALAEEQRQRAEEQARAAKRLRRLLAGLAIVSAIAVIAAVFALVQRSAAVEQHRIALSRQLAAQALNYLGTQPDLALLLSLQASHIGDSPEIKGSLFAALLHSPHLITYLHAHTDDIRGVAFGPDGKVLATAGADRVIYLWDVETHRPIGKLEGHLGPVKSVAFSPDGSILASASDDKTIILWNVETRQPLGLALVGHKDNVNCVAFSPDGRTLASASSDNTVRLWDVQTRQSTTLAGHEDLVLSVAWSPDGEMVASASSDKTIRLWDAKTGSAIGEPLKGHTDPALSVAFSPDGKTLASGSRDSTIRLWDVAERQPIGDALDAHQDRVASVAFSPDGRRLASGSWDNSLILWDTQTWEHVGEPLKGHTNLVRSVAFSPDGQMLASGANDDIAILWDIRGQESLGQTVIRHGSKLASVAISPDGTWLAFGTTGSEVLLVNVSGNEPISHTLHGHTDGWVHDVAFSPDGQTLASAGGDGRIILWNVASRQPRGEPIVGHSDDVLCVKFSPDGKVLASGSADNTIILWNVETGAPLGLSLQGHKDWVTDVEFSPDGKTLASCGWDEIIILWDVASRKPLFDPLIRHTSEVYDVAFSPDGRTLASAGGDAAIILWDVTSGKPLGDPLTGHTNSVMTVAFHPDGQMMASASEDDTIILWDLPTRKRIGASTAAHVGEVSKIVFAPDGRTLISASWDRTCVVWDVEFASWVSRACNKANRNLTATEWATFTGSSIPYEPGCPDLPDER